jgi:hypothetical protein
MCSKRVFVQRGADERSTERSERVLAWSRPQTGAPASACHGRDAPPGTRCLGKYHPADQMGQRIAPQALAILTSGRKPHSHSHRRPGEQRRHRDLLRGSWRRPARRADPRLPAQRPRLDKQRRSMPRSRATARWLRPARCQARAAEPERMIRAAWTWTPRPSSPPSLCRFITAGPKA